LIVAALARTSVVLVVCVLMGILSGRGVLPYLPAAGLSFGLVGSFVLNHGFRAERSSMFSQAVHLYGLAFVNYAVAFGAFLAAGLVRVPASS
jgi:hypothetical protein